MASHISFDLNTDCIIYLRQSNTPGVGHGGRARSLGGSLRAGFPHGASDSMILHTARGLGLRGQLRPVPCWGCFHRLWCPAAVHHLPPRVHSLLVCFHFGIRLHSRGCWGRGERARAQIESYVIQREVVDTQAKIKACSTTCVRHETSRRYQT